MIKEYRTNQSSTAIQCQSEFEWLRQVEATIRFDIERKSYNIRSLADHFHLSRRQFQRRIKGLTGLSPKKYQEEIALAKAKELLERNEYLNVTAVGIAIGMSNPTRFSEKFYHRFGRKPCDYFRKLIVFDSDKILRKNF